jgi:hypothetical protein
MSPCCKLAPFHVKHVSILRLCRHSSSSAPNVRPQPPFSLFVTPSLLPLLEDEGGQGRVVVL